MDYLLSKWSMMELIGFVYARRSWNSNLKILPLYYKIGVEDLNCQHDLTMAAWKKHSDEVVHVELKGYKDFKQENIIELQSLILETLYGASTKRRRILTVEQVEKFCYVYTMLKMEQLFDFKLPGCLFARGGAEFVQILLHFLSARSKAIVTSRSSENVRNVLKGKPIKISSVSGYLTVESIPREKVSHIRVPTSDEDEALKTFLHHALDPIRVLSPFTTEEGLETCINRCFYPNKDQYSGSNPTSGHYHPLSLQALGSYLNGIDSRGALAVDAEDRYLAEKKAYFTGTPCLIISEQGTTHCPAARQGNILDVAVFAPRGKLNGFHELCTWLGAVHGLDQEETLHKEPDFTSCSNLLELDMRLACAAVGHENMNPLDRLLSLVGTTLQVLQLTCWNRKLPELLVLGAMANLEVVEIVNDLGFSSPEGNLEVASLSALTRLRRLVLKNLPIRGSLPGLESLISLEILLLNRLNVEWFAAFG